MVYRGFDMLNNREEKEEKSVEIEVCIFFRDIYFSNVTPVSVHQMAWKLTVIDIVFSSSCQLHRPN